MIPLIGSRRREQLAEALGALDVTLSDSDVAQIEAAAPAEVVAGERYHAHQMRTLDSEKG